MDLVVRGEPLPPGVNSTVLRSLPIGWIESMINSPEGRAALAAGQKGTDPTDKALEVRARLVFEQHQPYAVERKVALTRPDGTDPDTFYRQVAEAYTATLVTTAKVALVLAEEAGVPVTTVHRWISEARRRGFLPPARRGKAG